MVKGYGTWQLWATGISGASFVVLGYLISGHQLQSVPIIDIVGVLLTLVLIVSIGRLAG